MNDSDLVCGYQKVTRAQWRELRYLCLDEHGSVCVASCFTDEDEDGENGEAKEKKLPPLSATAWGVARLKSNKYCVGRGEFIRLGYRCGHALVLFQDIQLCIYGFGSWVNVGGDFVRMLPQKYPDEYLPFWVDEYELVYGDEVAESTKEYIRGKLLVDEGCLYWKAVKNRECRLAGSTLVSGGRVVTVQGRCFLDTDLIYFLENGRFPWEEEINWDD